VATRSSVAFGPDLDHFDAVVLLLQLGTYFHCFIGDMTNLSRDGTDGENSGAKISINFANYCLQESYKALSTKLPNLFHFITLLFGKYHQKFPYYNSIPELDEHQNSAEIRNFVRVH